MKEGIRHGLSLILPILFALSACGISQKQTTITPSNTNRAENSSNQSATITNNTISITTATTPASTAAKETTANQSNVVTKDAATTTSSNVTATVTGETAREIALNYVASKFGILMGSLIIDHEEHSIVYDVISQEKVEIFVIRLPSGKTEKLVVDSTGKVMDVYKYEQEVGERNKAIAGHMNLGLYIYLQSIGPNDLVKVQIVTSVNSELVSFIESRGYKITRMGDVQKTSFIYVELPKDFILELAKRDDVLDMQQDLPYVPLQ